MDFEEGFTSPAFWMLAAIGEGALVLMLVVLKTMGNQSIMPTWVKLVSFAVVPLIAFVWAAAMGD
jgi:hypothetical protein